MERHDPDALTPREQEVLALLKRGYSNRDIASELQISLSGAKYHVSEIISKLGVSSREEAAGLERPQRTWGFLPLSSPSLGALRLLHLPVVKVALLAFAVGSIGLGGVLLTGWFKGSSGEPRSGAVEAFDPCRGNPRCSVPTEIEYATLAEAAEHASFEPMMPAFIPDGFEQKQVFAKERYYSNSYVPEVHNDWITVTFRDTAGNRLVISQGFGSLINARYAFPGEPAQRGTLTVNSRQALWSTKVPITRVFHPETDLTLALTLYLGRFGSGWGEEGSWFSGSPLEYTIASDSLNLETLIKIAESVTFPAVAEPNEGYSPEPFFD